MQLRDLVHEPSSLVSKICIQLQYSSTYLILISGEKISPMEVDAVLLSHTGIAQAVAFGVPDKKYGEEVN